MRFRHAFKVTGKCPRDLKPLARANIFRSSGSCRSGTMRSARTKYIKGGSYRLREQLELGVRVGNEEVSRGTHGPRYISPTSTSIHRMQFLPFAPRQITFECIGSCLALTAHSLAISLNAHDQRRIPRSPAHSILCGQPSPSQRLPPRVAPELKRAACVPSRGVPVCADRQ